MHAGLTKSPKTPRRLDQVNTQPGRPIRIALYSHDTCGLGHMRRNLLIAESLVEQLPNVNVLLITGARDVTGFRFPAGVDAVTLPSFYKEDNESYRSKSFDLDIKEFISFRSNIIKTSVERFAPDVFIVDKVPRGTMGELDDTLAYLATRPATHCVLGLRDILDQPEVIEKEWVAAANIDTITKYYDAIWVYGDRSVYDPCVAYNFPEQLSSKTVFTGYLDPSTRLNYSNPGEQDKTLLNRLGDRFYVCAVGGGQDGAHLAENFAKATFPSGVRGLIVTGPHMPAESAAHLQELVDANPHLICVNFLSEPLFVYRAAERMVTMGGYNTTLEMMGLGARVLMVPRVRPREEQWIRGRALAALGLIDMIHPDELTPEAISLWFNTSQPTQAHQNHTDQKSSAHLKINLSGLDKIPALIQRLLTQQNEQFSPSSNSLKPHALT